MKGKDGNSSHVAFDPSDGFLYVADTGHQRIARLDTTKGTKGHKFPRQFEPLRDVGFAVERAGQRFAPAKLCVRNMSGYRAPQIA